MGWDARGREGVIDIEGMGTITSTGLLKSLILFSLGRGGRGEGFSLSLFYFLFLFFKYFPGHRYLPKVIILQTPLS
ncbi:hypothetical protein LZ32DRAFT_268379 [Colletotrichum eremochloae]|nr:hypothetical protein LZ32DRAFT_268379 [Colletotrichum eremochloae]